MLNLRLMNDSDMNELKDFNVLFNSLHKNAVKYSVIRDNNLEGFIIINLVSAMNEYKLGKLFFDFKNIDTYDLIHEEFDEFLHSQIMDNYYIKMTCDLDCRDLLKINFLKNHKFVENKNDLSLVEMKITKPIFLQRS